MLYHIHQNGHHIFPLESIDNPKKNIFVLKIMAHKRKGQLTTTSEWAKHLGNFLKRQFWKGERRAGKKAISQELDNSQNQGLSNKN